jgi:microcystin-dependent protein
VFFHPELDIGANMSDPFIGEIKLFAGNFAPRNWAFCDGSIHPISENNALFSLLGNRYGGDGRTTFGLPDLRGRLPVHFGTGEGLSTKILGDRQGVETVVLTTNQMTSHTHNLQASSGPTSQASPEGLVLAKSASVSTAIYAQADPSNKTSMPDDMTGKSGENQPHPNIMPYLCLNYIIALFGTYPPRN